MVYTMIQSSYDQGFADSTQVRTARPVFLARFWLARRAVYLSAIALILGLYSYPALRTASTTGSWRLPAVSAPDLGLYLSLSNLGKDRDGSPLNPYQPPHLLVSDQSASVRKNRNQLGLVVVGSGILIVAGREF